MIVMFWFVEGACAQQTNSGAASSAAPSLSPASEETPANDADAKDNPTGSADWRERMDAAGQRHDDWLACVTAKRRNCSRASVPDPTDALLNDETLVNGDVVSTPNGLKVFREQSNVPHSLADFE